ncbi:hypothetical protein ACVNF4_16405 [Streptomyces sp. S6]
MSDDMARTDVPAALRAGAGPRHAAPKKPLLTRLHVPAGKAIALAAMPTAVLMGMGFTPTLARAEGHASVPNSQLAEEYKDCVAALEADDASASPSPSASESAAGDDKPDDAKDDAKTGKGGSKGEGGSGASDSGSDDKTQPSPSPSASGSAGEGASGAASPSPSPSASAGANGAGGGLLETIGDTLNDILTGGKAADGAKGGEPSPSPSGSASGAVKGPAEPSSSPSPKASEGASEGGGGKADDGKGKADDEDKASASASPSPSPSASASTDPDDCKAATKAVADGRDNRILLPEDPWILEASELTLSGADYQGVVEVTTSSGKKKEVLKYVISKSTKIVNLHQIVHDKQSGKTYHVRSGKGETSTIEDGKTTMYTESISGNLLGLLPVTFTPDSPPPLNLDWIYFTNVKVVQAGQFGGTLTIPGMKQTIS